MYLPFLLVNVFVSWKEWFRWSEKNEFKRHTLYVCRYLGFSHVNIMSSFEFDKEYSELEETHDRDYQLSDDPEEKEDEDEKRDTHARSVMATMLGQNVIFRLSHSTPQCLFFVSSAWREKWFGPKYRLIVTLDRHKACHEALSSSLNWAILMLIDPSLHLCLVSIPLFGTYTLIPLSIHKK